MKKHTGEPRSQNTSTLRLRIQGSVIRNRGIGEAAMDTAAWAFGLWAGMVLRFEFGWGPAEWTALFGLAGLAGAISVAILLQLLIGFSRGLYRLRYRFGSFDEVLHLIEVVAAATVALSILNATVLGRLVPTSVPVIGGLIALFVMLAGRFLWRLNVERRMRPSDERAQRVIVFGAGEGGVQLITAMMRNPDSPFIPVAILDDHPVKQHLQILGIPVLGGRHDMAEAAEQTGAAILIIAVPSADSELMRDLSQFALEAELDIKVLPPIHDLLDGAIGVGDIRPLSDKDLLGRHTIDTDLDSISGFLTARRVLVTGAGGSIGSELCYQIAKFAPDELIMLDRDESALHAIQLRIEGRAMLDDRNLVICDIRDLDQLRRIFTEHRPEVIFHTAALKHLPLLEMHPLEAVKTNIYGTHNLLQLAEAFDVGRFVNISTDKAADPTSVLGYTKRVAEMLTTEIAARSEGTFVSVRFGNVLGSRGSVLTAFHQQIRAGGPVTVTDPDATRYFMTVEEAVQLVIQAGAIGRDGEALVLDMGEPVRIDDVARRLVAEAQRPIEIVYTGLRTGEKLHEVLHSTGESDRRPVHPLISHVDVPPMDLLQVDQATGDLHDDELIATLKELAYRGEQMLDDAS